MTSNDNQVDLHADLQSPDLRSLITVAAVVGLIEVGIWDLFPPQLKFLGTVSHLLAAILIVVSMRTTLRNRPVPQTSLKSWMLTGAMTLLLVIAVLLLGEIVRTSAEEFRKYWLAKSGRWFFEKIAVVIFQQVCLHFFLFPNLKKGFGSVRLAQYVAALIFGLLHLPSLLIVCMTTLSGWIWMQLFRMTGRLTPLILSHLILAMLAYGAIPVRLNANMGVGSKGLTTLQEFREVTSPPLVEIYQALSTPEYINQFAGRRRELIAATIEDVYNHKATPSEIDAWESLYRGYAPADLFFGIINNKDLRETVQISEQVWIGDALQRIKRRRELLPEFFD